MVYQLRTYVLYEHNKDAFLARFRDHAARIMAGYGFQMKHMWLTGSGDNLQFIYLLEWPDEATLRQAWVLFRADQEWAEIKQQTNSLHGDMVGTITDDILIPVM